MQNSAFTGMDIGSRFVKIAVFKNKEIEKKIFDTAYFYKNFIISDNGALTVNFKKLRIPAKNVCATGYGRNNVNIKNIRLINELKAHVWGIFFQLNLENFTLIDIGGQDIKIIKVSDGYINDFAMNDKCAASTGRYLENMAKLLEIDINELSQKKEKPINLTSTCAIFGESEIIGKLAEGVNINNICAGINYSIAKRITSMMRDIFAPPLVITGGAALNGALIFFIKKLLQTDKVLIPEEPQFNGAIGCINYLFHNNR
jgi:predicted CoA-substrate-specific enzyme activase